MTGNLKGLSTFCCTKEFGCIKGCLRVVLCKEGRQVSCLLLQAFVGGGADSQGPDVHTAGLAMPWEANVVNQKQSLKSCPLRSHVTAGPLRNLSLDFFNP